MAINPSRTTPDNPVAALRQYGQSVWLDFLRRNLIESGEQVLARLARAGTSLDEVTEALLADGVQKYVEPYERLLASIARRLHEPAH